MTINKSFNEFIFHKERSKVATLNEVLKVLKSNSKVLSDKTFNIFIHGEHKKKFSKKSPTIHPPPTSLHSILLMLLPISQQEHSLWYNEERWCGGYDEQEARRRTIKKIPFRNLLALFWKHLRFASSSSRFFSRLWCGIYISNLK